jgi:hypothetical protein
VIQGGLHGWCRSPKIFCPFLTSPYPNLHVMKCRLFLSCDRMLRFLLLAGGGNSIVFLVLENLNYIDVDKTRKIRL